MIGWKSHLKQQITFGQGRSLDWIIGLLCPFSPNWSKELLMKLFNNKSCRNEQNQCNALIVVLFPLGKFCLFHITHHSKKYILVLTMLWTAVCIHCPFRSVRIKVSERLLAWIDVLTKTHWLMWSSSFLKGLCSPYICTQIANQSHLLGQHPIKFENLSAQLSYSGNQAMNTKSCCSGEATDSTDNVGWTM